MTTFERLKRTFSHREPDRVPIVDIVWPATIERWEREGMPKGVDWREFFGLDLVEGIYVDNSPRYETQILEDNDEFQIIKTKWGVTMKNFKHSASVPEFLDFTITSRE
ncbi:MAG TPA: hypothetical protein PLN24_06390, partial [Victivallales bacterium]|nr:hypothetical protein [Victivallales bacterium]